MPPSCSRFEGTGPYHQVTDRDAWIDDPSLPAILPTNHLYTLPPMRARLPPWWERNICTLMMRLNPVAGADRAHYENPVPEAGNAIFFHIRPVNHYRTAGARRWCWIISKT